MPYLGRLEIDDLLVFPANTHTAATGAATDADAVPSYRVYEDETGTPILTGTMALLDSANTAGFYSEQITLSAANGFEVGKSYTVYVSATVAAITGTLSHTFRVGAPLASQASVNTIDDFLDTELAAILAAVDTEVGAIKTVTDALPNAGALTNLASQASVDVIDNFLDTEVAAILAAVDTEVAAIKAVTDALPNAGALTNLDAAISTRATPAQVNTEVLDVMAVDTFAEAASVPAATSTLKDKINWLFILARNKRTQTATTELVRNDADAATVGTSVKSDDAVTFIRGEYS